MARHPKQAPAQLSVLPIQRTTHLVRKVLQWVRRVWIWKVQARVLVQGVEREQALVFLVDCSSEVKIKNQHNMLN